MADEIYIAPLKPTLGSKLIEVAKSQIGKQEIPKGSNWGPEVKKYLLSVGIDEPASWCMAFVYWCAAIAAAQISVVNPLYRTGGVMNQWYNTHPNNKVVGKPEAGNIFIMEFANGFGHTGIVESVDGDYIHTIEGNTNEDGSREGYEVARRKRLIASMHGFIKVS